MLWRAALLYLGTRPILCQTYGLCLLWPTPITSSTIDESSSSPHWIVDFLFIICILLTWWSRITLSIKWWVSLRCWDKFRIRTLLLLLLSFHWLNVDLQLLNLFYFNIDLLFFRVNRRWLCSFKPRIKWPFKLRHKVATCITYVFTLFSCKRWSIYKIFICLVDCFAKNILFELSLSIILSPFWWRSLHLFEIVL